MTYEHMLTGVFSDRPNRFIAHVLIPEAGGEGKMAVCHVKNTGRCRELLVPGALVLLEFHPDAAALGRKTQYSLIGVYKERKNGPLLINMDSQAPNQAALEWVFSIEENAPLPLNGERAFDCLRLRNIRREVPYGQSRFDLAFDLCPFAKDQANAPLLPAFMEVKGVTLEENGLALFPDAPTKRGVKHLQELMEASRMGYEAYVLFLIQMKGMEAFSPNKKTHPEFADALKEADEAGVHILAYDCLVTPDSMTVDQPVPVLL